MRLRLAVQEPAADPVSAASDAVTEKAVLPALMAARLRELTGGFELVDEQDGMRVLVAHNAKLELRIGPLVLRPATEDEARLRSLLSHGLTLSQRIHVLSDRRGPSAVGWPLRIVHATVVSGAGWSGGETEHRLVASYRFFEHRGDALLKIGDKHLFDAHRDEVLALLRSGWPLWSSPAGVAVLSELWQ